MFTLQKLNVVKIVATEGKRDDLLSKGFELVEPEKKKEDKKRGAAGNGTGTGSE